MARWDKDSEPTIPGWFFEAVETEVAENTVEIEECDVVYRTWPHDASAARDMLLIHGMYAHSHWWDFIAPGLTDKYRVTAMDLTGMGDSDYRYEYDSITFAHEIVGVCDAAGLADDVIIVAHSFGGAMAVKAVNLYPDRFGALILVDSGIRHPDDPLPETLRMGGRAKAYPDKRTAELRFRLQPPQPCENQYIVEYIGRNSVMAVDGGWAWKFDEDLVTTGNRDLERQPEDFTGLMIPIGEIYGADSELFSRRTLEYMRELVPRVFPAVDVENAQHHVFLDQPLAFIDVLREMAEQF